MFGLFKSPIFADPQLGELTYKSGLWRGQIGLGASNVPLAIAGSRPKPDMEALDIAKTLPSQFTSIKPLIAAALFDHYSPYAEAIDAGDLPLPADGLPELAGAADVWPHVSLLFVSVTPLGGTMTAELGYAVAWDEEHILGARVQDGRFVELCGSVREP